MFTFRKKRPLIVTIHGFGKKRHQEFDPLCTFLKKEGFETIQFDIYSLKDPQDAQYTTWIERCESQIKKALSKKQEIILIGFSMGGVIASYLASIYPVRSLILVAPAFQYLDLQKIGSYSLSALKKITQKEKKIPSSLQTRAFMEIVDHYKNSIYQVDCPLLILHGTKDEVISYESSQNVFQHVSMHKKHLLLVEGGKHRMLYDQLGNENVCFSLILDMIQKRLD